MLVDVHSHQFNLDEAGADIVAAMDRMNMGVMVNLSGRGFVRTTGADGKPRFGLHGPDYLRDMIALTERIAPGRIVQFTNVDFSKVEGRRPDAAVAESKLGYDRREHADRSTRASAWIRRMSTATASRSTIRAWRSRSGEACARLGVPVLIHTADPAPFWQPIDGHNERLYEMIES
ncbi:MAG: hypothetical protein R2862_01090 [Thermoanaerobaculia bacterium]